MQSLESEINFLRSELQEKNTLVKSLVTSHMLHENVHVPYKNVETNPCISPSKIIGATEFCSSGQVSNSDDVTDFHINYEQIATKDAKTKHELPSEITIGNYDRKLTLFLSLTKRKIIQKLIFIKRTYLKRMIYRRVKGV